MAFGLLDHEPGDSAVVGSVAVVAGVDHLGSAVLPAGPRSAQITAHLGHFLGPLVDQQHHEEDLGVVDLDPVGQVLEQDGLAGSRRRDDQATLALADRRPQIDDAHRHRSAGRLEAQPLERTDHRQIVERSHLTVRFRLAAVDLLDSHRGGLNARPPIPIAAASPAPLLAAMPRRLRPCRRGRRRHSGDGLAPAQTQTLDDRPGDGGVAGGHRIIAAGVPQMACAGLVIDFECAANGCRVGHVGQPSSGGRSRSARTRKVDGNGRIDRRFPYR